MDIKEDSDKAEDKTCIIAEALEKGKVDTESAGNVSYNTETLTYNSEEVADKAGMVLGETADTTKSTGDTVEEINSSLPNVLTEVVCVGEVGCGPVAAVL